MQTQRLELKYLIPDALAGRVRDFVAPYLRLDSFGAARPGGEYPVHSLYLDSDDLHLYRSTINGDRNRYKLRVRFYEGGGNAPVFFEIKRRQDNAILKQRCALVRAAAEEILAGRIPDRRDLAGGGSPEAERAMHAFCRHLNQIQARPVAHVFYQREAWLDDGANRVRVTMDRAVRWCRAPDFRLDGAMRDPVTVFGDQVVLELKFTGRFPAWMGELVRVFGLKQCSAAKYVDGLVETERCRRALSPPERSRRVLRLQQV